MSLENDRGSMKSEHIQFGTMGRCYLLPIIFMEDMWYVSMYDENIQLSK